MGKLHESLAVKDTKSQAAEKLLEETKIKFGKPHFFTGEEKSLQMLSESPENSAIQAAARESKPLITTAHDTLEYAFQQWAKAEDVLLQVNKTNQIATADLMFNGLAIATDVPVDELMGLEARLAKIRLVVAVMPTLDASKIWAKADDGLTGSWRTKDPEVTSKTEKKFDYLTISPATDKHPAQMKETTRDFVVGTFSRTISSGAATAVQKADMLSTIDDLISETRQARMRANSVEIVPGTIGSVITELLLSSFKL